MVFYIIFDIVYDILYDILYDIVYGILYDTDMIRHMRCNKENNIYNDNKECLYASTVE
jgi:hypothetical protein